MLGTFKYISSGKLRLCLLVAALVLGIGWCPLLSENCQWGKWLACILILGICIGQDSKHWCSSTMAMLATWAWCQAADAAAGCWKPQHAAWGMTCIAIFHATQGIRPKDWCKVVFFFTISITLLLVLRLCGMHVPWSIQLFNNPAGEAAALSLGWCCSIPVLQSQLSAHKGNSHHARFCCWAVAWGLLIGILLFIRSRTGFLAILLGTGICLYPLIRKKWRHSSIGLWGIGIFASFFTAIFLYARNTDSADGRCLIYRAVWSLCREKFWFYNESCG